MCRLACFRQLTGWFGALEKSRLWRSGASTRATAESGRSRRAIVGKKIYMLIRGNNPKQHARGLVDAARRVLTVALVLAVSLALGLATPSVAVAATPGI